MAVWTAFATCSEARVNSTRIECVKVFPMMGLRYHRDFDTQVARDAKLFNQ
jgi:hypothetical protein